MNRSFNKAEEEEKIKLLLRDDFIDDGESINLSNAPVVLPMIKEVKPCKQEIKIKKEVIEEEIDRKPIILENGEVLSPKKESKCKISKSDKDIKDEFLDSIPKIINNKIHSYILMQIKR